MLRKAINSINPSMVAKLITPIPKIKLAYKQPLYSQIKYSFSGNSQKIR